MNQVFCNEHTVKLAQEQLRVSFRDCYLAIQHCLLTFLKEAETEEGERKIKSLIQEVGETYKKTIASYEYSN